MRVFVAWVKRWLARDEKPASVSPSPVPMHLSREWTPADQQAFISYLATMSGYCLIQRMRCVAAENARRGAQDAMSPTYSAGRTTGFYDAIDWLESHARIQFEQTIPISGADADQSATSAQEQQGDALLREQYSP